MSALFMGRHRYSTINPEDIARCGGKRLSLNSIAFTENQEEEEFDDDFHVEADKSALDEEKAIGDQEQSNFKRLSSGRQSIKSRSSSTKHPILQRVYKKWKRMYRKYGFKHIIPILLLIAYSFVGALIFQAIEAPYAEKRKLNTIAAIENNMRSARTAILAGLHLPTDQDVNDKVWLVLSQFERNNSVYRREEMISWDIWGSLFYCGTIYTTVGYGNIYPETPAGKVCTMIYAFFGVPLLLAILSDIGQLLCDWMDRFWRVFKDHLPKRKNKEPNSSKGNDLSGGEDGAGGPDPGAPIMVAVLATFAWLLMCSALFCLWEWKWSYFTSFYFFFISLSTIGLGDVTPDNPMLMVLMSGFLIIGLCLVSMTIGVVQEHIALYLYRVMIALQKECEQLLQTGDDVDKKELVKKVWRKQPWHVRRLMPLVMGGENSKRLNDFAGATITDTAVQMGVIPPPPGYHRPLLFLASGATGPSVQQSNVRYVKPGNWYIDPADSVLDAAVTFTKPILPKIATVLPQLRSGQLVQSTEFLPGGRAVIRRSHSCTPAVNMDEASNSLITPYLACPKARTVSVQTDIMAFDAYKDNASTISLVSWDGTAPMALNRLTGAEYFPKPKDVREICVQTDLTGKEIVVKMETLSNISLASWCEDEELLPAPMRPMKSFAADDLLQFREVAQEMVSGTSCAATATREAVTQTDPSLSANTSDEEFSVSSAEFESALETKSFLFPSKSSQTVQLARNNAETQTGLINLRSAEVQTSSVLRRDAEIQYRPEYVDEEVQTDGSQRTAGFIDESGPGETIGEQPVANPEAATVAVDELGVEKEAREIQIRAVSDKYTQCRFKAPCCAVEVQTTATRTRNLEIQAVPSVLNAETQTEQRRISFQVSPNEGDEDNGEEGTVGENGEEPDMLWSYNAWFSDKRRKGLDSVLEEEEYDTDEEDSEDDDEEYGQQTTIDDEEDSGPLTLSDGAVTLPAITVSPPSSISSEASVSKERKKSKSDYHKGSYGCVLAETGVQTDESSFCKREGVSVACQTMRSRQQMTALITAAIATQTEDCSQRDTLSPPGQSEATVRRNRHGGSFRDKLSAWTERRRPKELHKNVAVQTEGYIGDGVRDIIIQTDDSYLRMARRLNALRTMRARSLRITVAPQLKQRLSRLAASSAEASRIAARMKQGKS